MASSSQSRSPIQRLEYPSHTVVRCNRRCSCRTCLALLMGKVGWSCSSRWVPAHRRHTLGHCSASTRLRCWVRSLARGFSAHPRHSATQTHWCLAGSCCGSHRASRGNRAVTQSRQPFVVPGTSCAAAPVRPNPSLEPGPPPAWHLAREALQVYAPPRGPSAIPAPAPQLKR